MAQLVRGIKEKLLVLPNDTKVVPGHVNDNVSASVSCPAFCAAILSVPAHTETFSDG